MQARLGAADVVVTTGMSKHTAIGTYTVFRPGQLILMPHATDFL